MKTINNLEYNTLTEDDIKNMSREELEQLALKALKYLNYQRSRKYKIKKGVELDKVYKMVNQKTTHGKKKYTAQQVANHFNVTPQTIYRWMKLYEAGVRTYNVKEDLK